MQDPAPFLHPHREASQGEPRRVPLNLIFDYLADPDRRLNQARWRR